VRNLDDEVLVYDLERNQAHCLSPGAGQLWRRCDGFTTVGEMVELLRTEIEPEANEQAVRHILLQLGKDHPLEEQVSRPLSERGITRRQLMQRAGVAVAAAAVTTLAVPAVGAHASAVAVCPNPPGGPNACCDPTSPGCQRNQNHMCVNCADSSGTFCCKNSVTNCCGGVCCGPSQAHCVSRNGVSVCTA
jgi:hypothetical protein